MGKKSVLLLLLALVLFSAVLVNSALAGDDRQGPPPPGTVDENGVEWGLPVDLGAAEDVSNKYETDEEAKRYTPPADAVNVTVDGVQVSFVDAWPYVNKDSRVVIPVRFIAEELQGTVTWDEKTKTVTIYRPYQNFMWGGFKPIERAELNITLKIGENSAVVNGETIELDTRAELKNGRTMVPLRFIAENLGAAVDWIAHSKTVEIHYYPVSPHTH